MLAEFNVLGYRMRIESEYGVIYIKLLKRWMWFFRRWEIVAEASDRDRKAIKAMYNMFFGEAKMKGKPLLRHALGDK